MRKCKKILSFVLLALLILPALYFVNVPKAKAEVKPVQIYPTFAVDGDKYIITLKWKNVPENQPEIDPDSGFLLYDVYKDEQKIKTLQQDLIKDNVFTDTMTKDDIQQTHTYYVIARITRPADQSVPSNTVTVTKESFTIIPGTSPTPNEPPEADTIPPPRVVGGVSGNDVTLKWDRTTYTGCDPDSGQIFYRIYKDDKQIAATQVAGYTGKYTDKLSDADAQKTHIYYLTTYCTRTADSIGGRESAPSNKIQYNPGENGQPGTITNPGGVVYDENDINPPSQTSETCGVTSKSWITRAIAEVLCAFIQGVAALSGWLTNTIFQGVFNA